MRIDSLLLNPAFAGKSPARADETAFNAAWSLPKANAPDPAKATGALQILPPSAATSLSFETFLTLQLIDAPTPIALEAPSAEDLFLEEAQKHPMERLREQILEELGLTEETLAQLPPEERSAMEDKIRQMIEEKLRQAMGGEAAPENTTAAMLKTLL